MSNGNIEVIHAWTQRGWSVDDHTIDDSRLDEIVGRTYATRAHALRAARARADKRGFAAIRYVDTRTGEVWEIGDEPNLPGRSRLCRRVLRPR